MLAFDHFLVSFDPDFAPLALDEVERAAPGAVAMVLAPGVAHFAGADYIALSTLWQSTPPVFVRHLAPSMVEPALSGTEHDLDLLRAELLDGLLEFIEPGESFSVQSRVLADVPVRPFDLNRTLSTAVEEATGATLHVRAPQQVVSLVLAERPDYDQALYGFMGISPAVANLSNWAGGMHRFAREEGQISRAEFKLLEALDLFGIRLPPRGVALDLGASPGGWTRVLRRHEQYVTAVDPGELDPRLGEDGGIRHLRMTAERYLETEPERFDLIVNDMRMDARESALLMAAFADHLYPHGTAVMTVKLPSSHRREHLDGALEILRAHYRVRGVRQLFHNRSEVTVVLQPAAA